ncbi:transposable element Tcb1 transposase [Trichonephila clavipes]|nr:transposable element Tcb1 transposase [Trichonephila clavipes]
MGAALRFLDAYDKHDGFITGWNLTGDETWSSYKFVLYQQLSIVFHVLTVRYPLEKQYQLEYSHVRKIGSRVGRTQTTVMWICDRWMHDGTTDQRGRSHLPQCTTSREDRKILPMTVTDRSVTSRTVAQHIESVTQHSVFARTIRRHLHQSGLSARHPLLGLPLTQNHKRFRRQWCDGRRMLAAEWNEVVCLY